MTFWNDESAATAIETALIAALMAAVIIVVIDQFGLDFNWVMYQVGGRIIR